MCCWVCHLYFIWGCVNEVVYQRQWLLHIVDQLLLAYVYNPLSMQDFFFSQKCVATQLKWYSSIDAPSCIFFIFFQLCIRYSFMIFIKFVASNIHLISKLMHAYTVNVFQIFRRVACNQSAYWIGVSDVRLSVRLSVNICRFRTLTWKPFVRSKSKLVGW